MVQLKKGFVQEPKLHPELLNALNNASRAVAAGMVVFVTGAPGAGKDWFASRLKADASKFVDLDQISTRTPDGKWEANIAQLLVRPAKVYVGRVDNFFEVGTAVAKAVNPRGAFILNVFPGLRLYRQVLMSRRDAGDPMMDVPEWASFIVRTLDLNDRELMAFLLRERENAVKWISQAMGDRVVRAHTYFNDGEAVLERNGRRKFNVTLEGKGGRHAF